MENAALLNAIIQNAIDGIITIDERGHIESINPSACKLFQYTPPEVVGHNISMLMPQPYRQEHDSYINRYQHTGQAHIIGITAVEDSVLCLIPKDQLDELLNLYPEVSREFIKLLSNDIRDKEEQLL